MAHTVCTEPRCLYKGALFLIQQCNRRGRSEYIGSCVVPHRGHICCEDNVANEVQNSYGILLRKNGKFLQLIGTIKRTIFKKVRKETILKIYNTLVLPTFYMGQKIGLYQPYKDEELKRQKWSYWDLWQATPFMITKQMTTYAGNYGLQAY